MIEGGFSQGCRLLGPQGHRRGGEVGRLYQYFAWNLKGLRATEQHEPEIRLCRALRLLGRGRLSVPRSGERPPSWRRKERRDTESLSSVGEGLSADLRALKLPAVLGPMTSEALASPAGRGLGLPWGPPFLPQPCGPIHLSLSCTHSCLSQAFVVQFLFVCWARGQRHLPPSLWTPPTPALHWLEEGML